MAAERLFVSVFIENRMTNRMDVLDGSIGQDNPVVMLVLHISSRCLQQQFTRAVEVLRVDSFPECLRAGHTVQGVEAENSQHLLRPVQRLASGGAPGPGAHVGQPLERFAAFVARLSALRTRAET